MSRRSLAPILPVLALCGCGIREDQESRLAAKQAQVEQRSAQVMPFDINRTMHHFDKKPWGGVQIVLSNDGDPRQVSLIRGHLKAEATRFQRGDFGDPGQLHGTDMPGLHALSAGASRIEVRYAQLPQGAQISYATRDAGLVTAIHSWFDAQVQEHGHHAMPM